MRTIYALLKRNLTGFFRDNVRVLGTMAMSLAMLFLTSFMMANTPGIDSPMNYLIAGVMVTVVFQGALNNSSDTLTDISSGFMKEIIVAPVNRGYIAIGNILSSALIAALQGLFMLIVGFVMGFRTSILNCCVMILLMLLSGVVFSAAALFLSLIAKNQTNFQLISSLSLMPAMLLSGAYIPITVLPAVIRPIVYMNPLTYLTGAFRYVALNMSSLTTQELVSQGVAFQFGKLVITPTISWSIVIVIGFVLFLQCVRKFNQIDLSAIK